MSTPRHMLVGLAVVAGCSEADGRSDDAMRLPSPPRPAGCVEVAAGTALQPVLDDPAVTAICLAPGPHAGPLRLARAVTLWGPPAAVVRAPSGTIVELAAPGATLLGLTLDGTGGSFDRLDGAVRLRADDTRVEGITVINAVFGILVEKASRVRVIGNHVEGSREPATGLRGDTVRLWETRDSLVADNWIEDGRDLVVWYSRGNTFRDNRIERARYGMHFMYSHDNRIEGNAMVRGVVGVFVMYSHGIHLRDNLIADAAGAAGMAIGLKDAGDVFIEDNRLIHDRIGIYLDASPSQIGEEIVIARNALRLNDTALVFHASAHDVRAEANDFADNTAQVRVDGGGDATGVAWRGNYFDDYAGYDLDGDGVGDVAYELRSLSNQLTAAHPDLALFRGTPALALVDAAAHLDPLYQPKPVLVDPAPRMAPRWTHDELRRQP